MMRDSRGRFVNDRVGSATLLLEVALEEAQKKITNADHLALKVLESPRIVRTITTYDRPAVVQMLAEATRSADLLLKGGA